MSEKTLEPARHELSDVPPAFIASGAFLLLLTVSLTALAVLLLYPGATTDRTMRLPMPRYPKPRLQLQAAHDWAQFHIQELARLNSSGWIDKSQGVAHIPIAVAMRKVAEENIPDWPGVASPQAPTASAPRPEARPTADANAEKANASAPEKPGSRLRTGNPSGARPCVAAGGRNCLPTKTRRPASARDNAARRKGPRAAHR